jgi:hypothetical protein
LELRVAMSLSRLWQQQGKRIEARKLLADISGCSLKALTQPTCWRRQGPPGGVA